MSEKKDFSLLRPFDLEAAKRGDAVCDEDARYQWRFISGGEDKEKREIVLLGADGRYYIKFQRYFRMAPLCWVEGRPVYKGDVLYRLDTGAEGSATAAFGIGVVVFSEWPAHAFAANEITWTPPKVKREVKLLAYLDDDQLFWLRETVPAPIRPVVRVPSEDKTITIEE